MHPLKAGFFVFMAIQLDTEQRIHRNGTFQNGHRTEYGYPSAEEVRRQEGVRQILEQGPEPAVTATVVTSLVDAVAGLS